MVAGGDRVNDFRDWIAKTSNRSYSWRHRTDLVYQILLYSKRPLTPSDIVDVLRKLGIVRKDGKMVSNADVGKDLYNLKKRGLAKNWAGQKGRIARGLWVAVSKDSDIVDAFSRRATSVVDGFSRDPADGGANRENGENGKELLRVPDEVHDVQFFVPGVVGLGIVPGDYVIGLIGGRYSMLIRVYEGSGNLRAFVECSEDPMSFGEFLVAWQALETWIEAKTGRNVHDRLSLLRAEFNADFFIGEEIRPEVRIQLGRHQLVVYAKKLRKWDGRETDNRFEAILTAPAGEWTRDNIIRELGMLVDKVMAAEHARKILVELHRAREDLTGAVRSFEISVNSHLDQVTDAVMVAQETKQQVQLLHEEMLGSHGVLESAITELVNHQIDNFETLNQNLRYVHDDLVNHVNDSVGSLHSKIANLEKKVEWALLSREEKYSLLKEMRLQGHSWGQIAAWVRDYFGLESYSKQAVHQFVQRYERYEREGAVPHKEPGRQIGPKSLPPKYVSWWPIIQVILESHGSISYVEVMRALGISRTYAAELLAAFFRAGYLSRKKRGRKYIYELSLEEEK